VKVRRRGKISVLNAWLALTLQTARLGLDAQRVVALRLMRLSGGGAAGLAEAQLMVTDKMAALREAHVAAAAGALTGDNHKAAKKVLRVFTKRVRANKTRLSKVRKYPNRGR
jgi:hypothetical protein